MSDYDILNDILDRVKQLEKAILTGNGREALVVRVDRLEQVRAGRTEAWKFWVPNLIAIAAVIIAIYR